MTDQPVHDCSAPDQPHPQRHRSPRRPARAVALEPRTDPPARRRSLDPAFVAFLEDRFADEARAAARRRSKVTPQRAAMTDRGLHLLDEILDDLREDRGVDPTTLELLKVAYGGHPDFRPEWHATTDLPLRR